MPYDMALPFCMVARSFSDEKTEDAADGHSDSGGIAASQHIASHDLAGGPDVLGNPSGSQLHAPLLVHLDADR